MTKSLLDPKNCARIKAPILLVQSEKDTYVRLDLQNQFIDNVRNAGGDITKVFMPGTRHELGSCKNEQLVPHMQDAIDFFVGEFSGSNFKK